MAESIACPQVPICLAPLFQMRDDPAVVVLSVGITDDEGLPLVVGLSHDGGLVAAMIFPFLLAAGCIRRIRILADTRAHLSSPGLLLDVGSVLLAAALFTKGTGEDLIAMAFLVPVFAILHQHGSIGKESCHLAVTAVLLVAADEVIMVIPKDVVIELLWEISAVLCHDLPDTLFTLCFDNDDIVIFLRCTAQGIGTG